VFGGEPLPDSADKIVIEAGDLNEIRLDPAESPRVEPKLPAAIPWWARLATAPLVLVLPLLCLITMIIRVAFRAQPPRTRHAWTAYLSTLLIISGILTTLGFVVALSVGPFPFDVSTGLAELDERTDYPTLPAHTGLSSADASQQLKSLVAVISPASRTWFGKREVLSMSFGAGMLLQATSSGYLLATARHVINTSSWTVTSDPRAFVSLESGVWSGADVVGRHRDLDLAMVWIPRHSGSATYLQAIAPPRDGEEIFVIGHPEGLKFTLSTGIISRTQNNALQISAPVSPGNSGGPVYDRNGNLVGVVSSTLDKSIQPNAENLNFAVSAEALLVEQGWELSERGRAKVEAFWKAIREARSEK
jgi:hypothetical protein